MFKLNIIISISIFLVLLGVTSFIKNQTRVIEKKIYKIEKKISFIQADLHETQLDYFYLSSPKNLSKKIAAIALIEYLPMDFSRIYLRYLDFNNYQKKISILKKNEKK